VTGLYQISMRVRDSTNRVIGAIDAATQGPYHVIDIENISSIPRQAWVLASLPFGTARLEFHVNPATGEACSPHTVATTSDRWWGDTSIMNRFVRLHVECLVTRNGGLPAFDEPLQCDEILDRRGNTQWQPRYIVPFQMTINVR